GCANMDSYRSDYPEPDDRLSHVLALYRLDLVQGRKCHEIARPSSETLDCMRLLNELDRLVMESPSHQGILMANAVFSYKAERKEVAQLMLDRLLAQGGSHPEAAILRARIAPEQGNVTGAVQLLERQTTLAPDNLDLRSALASADFSLGEYDRAGHLPWRRGTPAHDPPVHADRVGLLHEAEGRWEEACPQWQLSISGGPGFAPARARAIGLAQ